MYRRIHQTNSKGCVQFTRIFKVSVPFSELEWYDRTFGLQKGIIQGRVFYKEHRQKETYFRLSSV